MAGKEILWVDRYLERRRRADSELQSQMNPLGVPCTHCDRSKMPQYEPFRPKRTTDIGSQHCPVCCEMPCACKQIMEGKPGSIKRVDCVHCADTGFMPTPCTYCGKHKSLLSDGPTVSFPGMTGLHRRGPRVTEEDIDLAVSLAKDIQYHRFPHTAITVCCLTMSNGFCVIGYSAAASLENFDMDTGMSLALDEVKNKLWELLGFRLKQALFDGPIKDRP